LIGAIVKEDSSMKRERRVYEEVSEEDFGVRELFRGFIYAVIVLLSTAFLIFLVYYAKINEPYHPTGVDLTYQDKQVLVQWRERVLYQNIIEDNPLIEPVKYIILFKLWLYALQLVIFVFCYLLDRVRRNGVSNLLAITSGNRFKVDFSGKLLMYRDDEGNLNKNQIIRDLLLFGIHVVILAMFVCVGFIMEVL
jgi:hypothetical protein